MKRDGLTLVGADERVLGLWTFGPETTAAVLALLHREAAAGRARCTFDGIHPKPIIDGPPVAPFRCAPTGKAGSCTPRSGRARRPNLPESTGNHRLSAP